MKPAPFDYIACSDIAEATDCLTRYGEDARILAGGQSLIAMLNMRLTQPQVLADISRVKSLTAIHDDGNSLIIESAVTQASTGRFPQLQDKVPLLVQALPSIGHYQTRNKGTICGSLAHADPSSELPLIASVLNASLVLESSKGARTLVAREFFTGLLQTARQPDELIKAVHFPHSKPGETFGFTEFAMRHGDFAIVAIAVKRTAQSITIGVGGGPDVPEVREWPMLTGTALDDALNALAWDIDFQSDAQAPAAYRRRLVRLLGRQIIEQAIEQANAQAGEDTRT